MRKTIFMLLSSFLVVALVAVIPADLAAAKRVSPPQPTKPVSAQQADIEALIEDILLELNQAKGMTTDQGVIDEIYAIIDMVRKLGWLDFTNQEDGALNLKRAIAERLEKLINDLPLATAGMTTAVAAVPASNPLYEELVRVRAKIDRLIELETPSLEITPVPPPTISRVPETERLIVYSAKFLCGPAFGKEGVQRGSYSTAINVHNPHNGTVYLYKKAVIAKREDEPRGRISEFRKVILGPDEAIEIDCIDVYSLLGPEPDETEETQQTEAGLTTLSIDTSNISPVSSLVRFIKGFVVIYASAPLDVVAVYTASTTVGFSLDVEYLSPSTTATVPVTEEEECPQGCRCLTRKEAAELGLTAPCNGEMTICEYDDQQNPLRYCFGKPSEQVPCPQGCECLSLTPAEAERLGYSLCNGRETVCGYDDQQNRMLCYEKPTGVECPQGCACLAKNVAEELDYPLCNREETWCGTDATTGVDMYCYERTSQVECPQGCECLSLSPAAAQEEGLVQCLDVSCGTDSAGNLMYCYRKPTQVECPQGCECLALTPAEAEEKGLVQCLDVSCGTDASGRVMYCYERATQVECPRGCECLALTPAEAERLGYSLCLGQEMVCGYDAAGNAMYCYEETTEAECPQGCECLSELEARKLAYSLCGGQYIPCDYVPGGPQKWCYEPYVATRLTIEPSQDSNLIGTEHTVTVLVYDKYGNPLPNAKVTITVNGVHSLGPVTLTTNTSGKAVFEYTGKSAGTDIIVATVDGLQATAFKTWYQRGQQ